MFIGDGLEMELEEARAVYRRMHGRADARVAARCTESSRDALDQRRSAGAAVGRMGRVLPASHRDAHRHDGQLSSPSARFASTRPNDTKRQFDARLGHLTMFPVGTVRRTKGSEGTEADLAYLRDVIALTAKAPELITARSWKWFELGGSLRARCGTNASVRRAGSRHRRRRVPFEAGLRHAEGPPGRSRYRRAARRGADATPCC